MKKVGVSLAAIIEMTAEEWAAITAAYAYKLRPDVKGFYLGVDLGGIDQKKLPAGMADSLEYYRMEGTLKASMYYIQRGEA